LEKRVQLRREIEPDFVLAAQRYPLVLDLLEKYADHCDRQGDETNDAYVALENELHALTGKDMSQFNLWEWWEEDGIENLAFDISLTEPVVVAAVGKDELSEIVRRLKTFEAPSPELDEFEYSVSETVEYFWNVGR
jgi:hypothetical protein